MSMKKYTEKFRLAGTEERPMNIVYYILREHIHGKVLDVGCGQGRHLMLMPEGSIGIDLHPNKELVGDYELLIHDLDNGLPFKDNSFDVIFGSHVLEHLETPYKTLKDFYRYLKRGGGD